MSEVYVCLCGLDASKGVLSGQALYAAANVFHGKILPIKAL